MSKNEGNSYHLRYFDLRARGEPIRWILKVTGVDYTEERMPKEKWPTLKNEFDFRRCPVLLVNGIQLHQTSVICKYLAITHGLAPSDNWLRARLEEMAESIHDVSEHFAVAFFGRFLRNDSLFNQFLSKGKLRVFEVAELIEENIDGNEWIRSEKMTWVDIFVASYMDIYEGYFSTVFDKSPKLKRLVDKVRNIPAINSWLETRPPCDSFEIVNE